MKQIMTLLLLISVGGCVQPEEGIDTTMVIGTVSVPPSDALAEKYPDGFDPESVSILVGAYSSSDINDLGNPVGGAEVTGWALDEASGIWSGTYEIYYLKTVENVGTEDAPAVEVTEGVTSAFLVAGDFYDLNEGIWPGTLYSSPLEITVNGPSDQVIDAPEISVEEMEPIPVEDSPTPTP